MSSLRTTEHRRRAARAGLTYVTDAFAGITRKRAGELIVLSVNVRYGERRPAALGREPSIDGRSLTG